MSERPILFSEPMVRAILDGRKTVTRRVVKWPLMSKSDGAKRRIFGPDDIAEANELLTEKRRHPLQRFAFEPTMKLWVKSKWLIADLMLDPEVWVKRERSNEPSLWVFKGKAYPANQEHVRYAAELTNPGRFKGAFRSSLLMPRWASRLTLRTSSVRIEPLQDITADEIQREGAVAGDHYHDLGPLPVSAFDGKAYLDLKSLWVAGWDSINGKKCPWKSRPWVWRIEFSVAG